ncbi:RNA polymerase sigma factor [Aquimarina litoralis]|uniref:RNA polymerase sigma factor n=1 Tax=Aquimarina litoralis TaxID=584605 RepID=UPI001C5898ED|nr:sigma-70 family RNA polymerase sigma factor [Aquimarina litoralis]MBW1297806.1 sigma-70 family RNA polymerase sigma factor [Aquimarina litoralis]
MNSTTNKHIIKGIIAGDHQTLKSFYKKDLTAVRRFILKYNGTTEDVEDVFQEAMVLLYHKARSGELETLEASIHAYFIGICKNKWRNQWRKQRILEYQELRENNTLDPSESIVETLTKAHQQDVFQKHFTRLSTSSKQILQLFFEGKSMKDIASRIGFTEGYTRKKKHINKERLIQMVQNDPAFMELMVR